MIECISKLEIIGVDSDGRRFTIIAKVGKPNPVEGKSDLWACPISLEPLYKNLPDVQGVNSFQASCLASKLIIDLLRSFKEKGGKLQDMTGEDVPLNAYGFD